MLYILKVTFEAEDEDEAHEQMDRAMSAFYSIEREERMDEDGKDL